MPPEKKPTVGEHAFFFRAYTLNGLSDHMREEIDVLYGVANSNTTLQQVLDKEYAFYNKTVYKDVFQKYGIVTPILEAKFMLSQFNQLILRVLNDRNLFQTNSADANFLLALSHLRYIWFYKPVKLARVYRFLCTRLIYPYSLCQTNEMAIWAKHCSCQDLVIGSMGSPKLR